MELYHFTASRHLPLIRKQGLTIGGISTFNERSQFVGLLRDTYIWLTSDPSFSQDWENSNKANRLIKYDRTDWRITVEVPESGNLIKWTDCKGSVVNESTFYLLSAGFRFRDWWLYQGQIPKQWFKEIAINPSKVEVTK